MGHGWRAFADMFTRGMYVGTFGFSKGVEFLDIIARHGCAFIDAIGCGLSVGSSHVVAGDIYAMHGAYVVAEFAAVAELAEALLRHVEAWFGSETITIRRSEVWAGYQGAALPSGCIG